MKRRLGGSTGLRTRYWPTVALMCVAGVLALVAFHEGLWGQAGAANPLRGRKLFVEPNSKAAQQAAAWARSRPADAAMMRVIAEQPHAMWLGEWVRDIRRDTDAAVSRMSRGGAIPVFVAYNIPYRDCGLHSKGGARNADAYRRWIIDLARGINNRPSVVILEPDAVPASDCLPARLKDERFVLLREAAENLRKAGAIVYIDAGHANWQRPEEMATRLQKAGIDAAAGFALNVSNFQSTSVNVTYGDRVSRLTGGKHYVIDTSRNGGRAAAGKEWCNAKNQALGQAPTTSTRYPNVDAFLWVKAPGESDGPCNGGPRAGEWWADYALELSKAAEAVGSLFPR